MQRDKPRDRMEIFIKILEVCESETYITHLVCKAKLNYILLGKYLEPLEKNGMLVRGNKCLITEAGRDFLKEMKEVSSDIGKIRNR